MLFKSFGNVAMTPQLLADASKFAALAACHQRRCEPSHDGSQVRALSRKLFVKATALIDAMSSSAMVRPPSVCHGPQSRSLHHLEIVTGRPPMM
jgi:hypothetical protein